MEKKTGVLTLIPTPLDDQSPLEQVAFSLLKEAVEKGDLIAVEDHKPCRRRWLNWGLPREAIENFICLNEHTSSENSQMLFNQLKQGKSVYLMSDCGLPAFCDPGVELVDLCHQGGVRVTASPYPNSFTLALALSGFEHRRFNFHGFIPKKGSEREKYLQELMRSKVTSVTNDTPYRLKALLEQLQSLSTRNHEFFLALDLSMPTEQLLRGSITSIMGQITDFKREFVLVISQINPD